MTTAETIKALRKKYRLNQKEFAELIGISPSHVSLLESGKAKVTIDKMSEYCERINVKLRVSFKF